MIACHMGPAAPCLPKEIVALKTSARHAASCHLDPSIVRFNVAITAPGISSATHGKVSAKEPTTDIALASSVNREVPVRRGLGVVGA